MTTNIYKNEFKQWFVTWLANTFPCTDNSEKVLTLYKVTEDIHNTIHEAMFVDDDDELNRIARKIVTLPQSDEKIIVFDFNYEYD